MFRLTGEDELPYGMWPRLLFAWICTEVERTGLPKVVLGASLNEFLQHLGVNASHREGQWISTTGLCDQMRCFFSCGVGLQISTEFEETSWRHVIAALKDSLWVANDPAKVPFWTSSITVDDPLFREIMSHPVTLDVGALAAAVGSLLRLDLFLLLTYRMHDPTAPVVQIPWDELRQHFRPELEADTTQIVGDLSTAISRELRVLKAAWPALDYQVTDSHLEIRSRYG